MGCDIHSYVEVRYGDGWQDATEGDGPFAIRNYGIFGFLADVRNYAHSPVITEPRGLPKDVSAKVRAEYESWEDDAHNASWLTVAELLVFDYDQVFWDRRVTRDGDGAALAEEGEGRRLPLREFLGVWYFGVLGEMAKLGNPADVRVVFWFDS